MTGLREKIEGLDSGNVIVGFQDFQIPDLGGWIAAHVDDPPRSKGDQLLQKFGATPFPRWIDHDCRFARGKTNFGENSGGIALDKSTILDPVLTRIAFRPIDGRSVNAPAAERQKSPEPQ